MTTAALLVAALLFGGMVLYSFGFAAFLLTALPAETAGPAIRRAFPHFYLFVFVTAVVGAALSWPVDRWMSFALAGIGLTVIPTRQLLMPAINRATDTGSKARFKWLHGLSVVITIAHIATAGWILSQFISVNP